MNDASPVLTARAITKDFRSGGRRISVLRGADLEVSQGESVSIRGESGCGKTTFLNIVAGLENPDTGDIAWGGCEVNALSPAKLADKRSGWIGMVFQAYYLIPELDTFENIVMAARISGSYGEKVKRRAGELLTRVGLGERQHSSTTHLSGGERQRVAVARALMNVPAIVLADEPTGNLDEKTAGGVMDLLLEICREESAGLILVTHNPVFAKRTDRQILLHNGVFEEA